MGEQPVKEETIVELSDCSRCALAHRDLVFKQLTRPLYTENNREVYTHWTPCPTNGEPIMMRVLEKNKYNKAIFSEPVPVDMSKPAPVLPVDRSAVTTLHGTPIEEVREQHAKEPVGMHRDYVVLTDEERKKGYVRPVRNRYRHVGIVGPQHSTRPLTEEEQERYKNVGYALFEKYPEESSKVGRYWTQKQLDSVGKGCGSTTRMADEFAETYARSPSFYGATFCVSCNKHLPVGEGGEFVWDGTDERVGT